MRNFWKKYHKWAGLIFAFILIMYSISGIILNHRQLFSSIDIKRKYINEHYHYKNWNNGFVKSAIKLSEDSLLIYGVSGLWTAKNDFSNLKNLNQIFPVGVDNHKINSIIKDNDGKIYIANQFALYEGFYPNFKKIDIDLENDRLSDIIYKDDSIYLLSRSHIFINNKGSNTWQKKTLVAPIDYKKEESLFKQIWLLHSGELFGEIGKLFVDFIALIFIFLSISGIIYMFFPKYVKYLYSKRKDNKTEKKFLNLNNKWHNKIGLKFFWVSIFVIITGMCLRPPLMIPLILGKSKPIPYSKLDSPNAWNNKLRAIRWDDIEKEWILSTSLGFFTTKSLDLPAKYVDISPKVSPMGINVFERNPKNPNEWLIGSFNGLFRWDRKNNKIYNYFDNKEASKDSFSPISDFLISGFYYDKSNNISNIFDYEKGLITNNNERTIIQNQGDRLDNEKISLWNLALEVHVGRFYAPWMGIWIELFAFFAGLLGLFVFISGIKILKKNSKKYIE